MQHNIGRPGANDRLHQGDNIPIMNKINRFGKARVNREFTPRKTVADAQQHIITAACAHAVWRS